MLLMTSIRYSDLATILYFYIYFDSAAEYNQILQSDWEIKEKTKTMKHTFVLGDLDFGFQTFGAGSKEEI